MEFRAFFVEQRDIGQPEVLADVDAELRLDADDFRVALDAGRYADAYRRALHRVRQLQITVLPTFLFEGQRPVGMPSAEG